MNKNQIDHLKAAINAADQAMTQALEAQKMLTELLGDMQEMNREMAEMIGAEDEDE